MGERQAGLWAAVGRSLSTYVALDPNPKTQKLNSDVNCGDESECGSPGDRPQEDIFHMEF